MTAKAEQLYNKISTDLLGEIKFGSWKQSAGNTKKEAPTLESIKKFEDFMQRKQKSNVLKPPSKKKNSK